MSHCVTFHQNNFLSLWNIGLPLYELLTFRFRFPISVLHHGGLRLKLPWTKTFFQKTVSVIIWHLTYSFHKNPAALSSRTHRSEAYPLCKNAMTDPFNRDPEGLPKNVLFTTLQLNRKCTAFPQDSMENGFPMSSGMQSGACAFLAANIRRQPIIKSSFREELDRCQSFLFLLVVSLLQEEEKTALSVVVARLTEPIDEVCFLQWLPSTFVWWWGLMLLMAGRYAWATMKTLSSLYRSLPLGFVCLFISDQGFFFFFITAFIWLHSSVWAESEGLSHGLDLISSHHDLIM